MVLPELQAYVEAEILPRYDAFDKAHRRPHAERVIRESLTDIPPPAFGMVP